MELDLVRKRKRELVHNLVEGDLHKLNEVINAMGDEAPELTTGRSTAQLKTLQ